MDKQILFVVLVLGLFLVAGCTQKTQPDVGGGNSVGDAQELTGETKEFRVEAFQFGYEPSVIEVNEGDTVRIIASSRDVSHGLVISQFGVNLFLGSDGTEQTAEFVADKKGTFSFFCNVPCGSGHGSMRGLLIVN